MELTLENRTRIVTLKEAGFTNAAIVAKMRNNYHLNISPRTIRKTMKRYRETGSNENRARVGRPRKCTGRAARQLYRTALNERSKSIPTLCSELSNIVDGGVSCSTVRRTLAKYGLKRRIAAKKPLLNKRQREKRATWAAALEHWPVYHWYRVLFTDEKIFRTRSCRRGEFVTRRVGERMHQECIIPSPKNGPQVHVWGAIGYRGAGPLIRINGKLNAARYQTEILADIDRFGPRYTLRHRPWIFMQDLAPPHSAASTQRFLQGKGVEILDWAGNSPDMNPIENVWQFVQRQLPKRMPRNENELMNWIRHAWARIPYNYIRKLYRSMPRRVQAILKSNGGPTRYWFLLNFLTNFHLRHCSFLDFSHFAQYTNCVLYLQAFIIVDFPFTPRKCSFPCRSLINMMGGPNFWWVVYIFSNLKKIWGGEAAAP